MITMLKAIFILKVIVKGIFRVGVRVRVGVGVRVRVGVRLWG